MNRTIIDVLNVADQERFHSSMVAWMLNPKGEHGFGSEFGNRILTPLSEMPGTQVKEVEVEKVDGNVRYDIWIQTEDNKEIVLENKTKSFGEGSQLAAYKQRIKQGRVIALGLDDLNFDEEEREQVPFVCYRDVLNTLNELGDRSADDAFKGLIQHYRTFLGRELGRLEVVRRAFCEGEEEALREIVQEQGDWIRKNDNNRRFYNSFYLALLRARLETGLCPGIRWLIEKNVQSGVVMYQANPVGDEHPKWALEPCRWDASCVKPHLLQYRQATGKWDVSFWIELELNDGVFAAEGLPSGEMRLKASLYEHSRANARQIQEQFESNYHPSDGEQFPKRHVSGNKDTFTLLRRPITRDELVLSRIEVILGQWHDKHGLTPQ